MTAQSLSGANCDLKSQWQGNSSSQSQCPQEVRAAQKIVTHGITGCERRRIPSAKRKGLTHHIEHPRGAVIVRMAGEHLPSSGTGDCGTLILVLKIVVHLVY